MCLVRAVVVVTTACLLPIKLEFISHIEIKLYEVWNEKHARIGLFGRNCRISRQK